MNHLLALRCLLTLPSPDSPPAPIPLGSESKNTLHPVPMSVHATTQAARRTGKAGKRRYSERCCQRSCDPGRIEHEWRHQTVSGRQRRPAARRIQFVEVDRAADPGEVLVCFLRACILVWMPLQCQVAIAPGQLCFGGCGCDSEYSIMVIAGHIRLRDCCSVDLRHFTLQVAVLPSAKCRGLALQTVQTLAKDVISQGSQGRWFYKVQPPEVLRSSHSNSSR